MKPTFFQSKLNLFFIVLLIASAGYFWFWAQAYVHGQHLLILATATLFGLFMAFNIGGNDVANSFGTSVGAGTLTMTQALLVAAIFEVSGAIIAGGEVTETIRKGIVDLSGFNITPMQFLGIMMSSLLAAGLWLLLATRSGWPVSTTHSIIGGIVGSSITLGFIVGGPDSGLSLLNWAKIGQIALSWVISPLLGGLAAYTLYAAIKHYILVYNEAAYQQLKVIQQEKQQHKEAHKQAFERLAEVQKIAYTESMARDAQIMAQPDIDPDELESDYYRKLFNIEQKKIDLRATHALETWVPFFAALGGMVISSMLLFKGLKNLHLGLSTLETFLIMAIVGAIIWMTSFIFARTLKSHNLEKSTFLMFSWMQVFTASGFAFSHGSNDIANAIGPFAAILDILRTGAVGAKEAQVPSIALITFGITMIAGLWFIGKEVIQTVGHNLTHMHPSSGFSAELSAAAVVLLATLLGIPVSSTHILIGAVLGVGLVNQQTNWQLMKPIALAWVITLPTAALLAGVTFIVLSHTLLA
ncbi:MAG: inorganic phosphate transporter [Methylococcales bacterium]|nr:inorganic phosphate transporter [Methylococcales bacterium]